MNIVSGLKTGAKDRATANPDSGFWMMGMARIQGTIMKKIRGVKSCWASFSELDTAPPAA
jgi:hypothetical protein